MNPAEQLRSSVQKAQSARELIAALRAFYSLADANAEGALRATGLKLACRDGCALCCVFRVEVHAHEVFAVADYIERTFSEIERNALVDRLRAHANRVRSMTPEEHKSTNVTCPLLVGGRCSVYLVRPFGCRRHHSTDVNACQHSYDHPDDMEFPGARDASHMMLWAAMGHHATEAFASAGYNDSVFELGTALMAALINPSCARRWKQGKNPLLDS